MRSTNKYNYIILGSEWDLYRIAFSDLKDYPNVKYVAGMFPPKKSLKGILYRVHFNPRINNIINLPLKNLWIPTYFDDSFPETRQLCFIIFRSWLIYNPGLIDFIRRKYPTAKIVVTLFDLMSKSINGYKKILDSTWLKKNCDLVTSFDQGDCEKYGFTYHPLVMSEYRSFDILNIPESDVYMLAMAKDRLTDIYGIYESLKAAGLKVDMILGGVRKENRKYCDDIKYLDGQMMSYSENLAHVVRTKCILEVMQKGGTGYTQRACEAVVYGKKFLTNNCMISTAPFYNPQYISQFTTAKNLDKEFLKQIPKRACADYSYKENMSPTKLLGFIEAKL